MEELKKKPFGKDYDRKMYFKEKNALIVKCPFNPEHLVRKKRLGKHIRACPDNPELNPTFGKPYISLNCNRPLNETLVLESNTLLPFLENDFFVSGINPNKEGKFTHCGCEKLSIAKLDLSVLNVLMNRVETLYKFISEKYSEIIAPVLNDSPIDQRTLDNIELPRFWENPNQKNTVQCFSIVKHLIDKEILKQGTDEYPQQIIEGGAGTGQLTASYLLLPHEHRNIVYMIDKMNFNKRFDRIGRGNGDMLNRIQADLSDVDGLELIKYTMKDEGIGGIAIIGKHLCGSATDMVLRMAVKCGNELNLQGIGIALCCHMKGDGHDDCMSEFFKSLGVSLLELTCIHRMCSWVTAIKENEGIKEENTVQIDPILRQRQKSVGEMCRIMLNVSRVVWLKQQECISEVGLVKFCHEDVTPENVLLWAKGKKNEVK